MLSRKKQTNKKQTPNSHGSTLEKTWPDHAISSTVTTSKSLLCLRQPEEINKKCFFFNF